MESEQWKVMLEKPVPYYEETQERTIAQKLHKVRNTIFHLLAYVCPNNSLRIKMQRKRGVHIGKNVYIGMFCFFDNLAPEYIYIEDNASINAQTMILTHFNPMKQFCNVLRAHVAPVVVHKGAIVAVRSTIMPGVEIGKYAIVSGGSVVEKSVPNYTMVKGNPAKKVAEYEALI